MKRNLCVCLGVALAATLAAAAANPPAALQGDYIEARTCDVYTGPCFANAEFGLTGDQAVLAWHVNAGSWNGVELAGRTIVAVVKASATLADEFSDPYPAKCLLIVDEKATATERDALMAMAQSKGGRLLDEVVRVDSAAIEMTVKCCEEKGCAKLTAGKVLKLETRCPNAKDHVCGNERVYYQPLTAVEKDFVPAVTVSHEFTGAGLNATWSSPNKRSAFIGSFGR